MLYDLQAARDNVRNRDGKRVFYLAKGDQLTSDARDHLLRERIEILPAEQARPARYRLLNGGYLEEKPEEMTHLHGDVLVSKTHPRIAFRGAIDTLEAEFLLCALALPAQRQSLLELLGFTRQLLRCEVMEQPLPATTLLGLTPEALRSHSHRPQDYYGKPHFMPEISHGETVLRLNRLRTLARAAELQAARAFTDGQGKATRPDLLQGLNRLSSALYILMIQNHP